MSIHFSPISLSTPVENSADIYIFILVSPRIFCLRFSNWICGSADWTGPGEEEAVSGGLLDGILPRSCVYVTTDFISLTDFDIWLTCVGDNTERQQFQPDHGRKYGNFLPQAADQYHFLNTCNNPSSFS